VGALPVLSIDRTDGPETWPKTTGIILTIFINSGVQMAWPLEYIIKKRMIEGRTMRASPKCITLLYKQRQVDLWRQFDQPEHDCTIQPGIDIEES
jgi:hypothetical protein